MDRHTYILITYYYDWFLCVVRMNVSQYITCCNIMNEWGTMYVCMHDTYMDYNYHV
jgi:hypothetical protein